MDGWDGLSEMETNWMDGWCKVGRWKGGRAVVAKEAPAGFVDICVFHCCCFLLDTYTVLPEMLYIIMREERERAKRWMKKAAEDVFTSKGVVGDW